MTERLELYKCEVCGNTVQVLRDRRCHGLQFYQQENMPGGPFGKWLTLCTT